MLLEFENLMATKRPEITELEEALGFTFGEHHLYVLALTHSSFANEQKDKQQQNQRLELLGDSVLSLCITEYLYQRFPLRNEGQLSRLKSYIVSAESLAEAAGEYDLGRFILLSKGESQDNGRHKESILANVLEALIGACYLDQGLDKARELVLLFMRRQLELYQNQSYLPQDAKLQLQEYAQKHYKVLPQYQTVPYSCGFEAKLYINGTLICSGTGSNKKQAEKQAAQWALKHIAKGEGE